MDRRSFLRATSLMVGGGAAGAVFSTDRDLRRVSMISMADAATVAPEVETTGGKLRGSLVDGIFDFKGIPYGASTAGAGRFMPPKKPAPWKGVRDAVEWGTECVQK